MTFKYKQFQFVSCLGVKPYFDSSYGLAYGRKITDRFSLDVGARLLGADYTVGNLGSCLRNDLDYILSAGLHYAFSAHLAADLGYSANLGRNAQDNIVNPENRDFNSREISAARSIQILSVRDTEINLILERVACGLHVNRRRRARRRGWHC